MTEQTKAFPEIRRDFARVSSELVAQAAGFQAAILADVNERRGALHGRIAAVSPSMKLAGSAVTVEVRPGDNLMIHAAMAIAHPGDVLVIDGKGDLSSALMGAIMMNQAKAMGLAGVVVDGAVRDILELQELGFPVFAAGTNPNGPTKYIPGRVNWDISIGGVAIHPGDLVVGDADGVVVIEREKVASLMAPAARKVADENKRIQGILRGEQLRPGWLDGALAAAGLLKQGETL
ncbi:MAG TPA: RraA family protein [Noviherbaspirillum sp.]|nr:RraA family protein [Noviherbaspirillum sp.]